MPPFEEGVLDRLNRSVDLLGAVGRRDEGGLERRGRQVHSAVQEGPEEAGIGSRIGLLRLLERTGGAIAETDAEHRPDALNMEAEPGVPRGIEKAPLQGARGPLESGVK